MNMFLLSGLLPPLHKRNTRKPPSNGRFLFRRRLLFDTLSFEGKFFERRSSLFVTDHYAGGKLIEQDSSMPHDKKEVLFLFIKKVDDDRIFMTTNI